MQNVTGEAALQNEETQRLIDEAYEQMDGNADRKKDKKHPKWEQWKANFKRHWWILLFILPALIYVIIFCYLPMYGILVAFQDYMPGDSVVGPDTIWVGWQNFETFFSNPNFLDNFFNTFLLLSLIHI